MTAGTPPTTFEQFRQLNRSLMEKVLNRAASDSEWRQRLLDDPETAVLEAGFPEAERPPGATRLTVARGGSGS
jgi:hypothetical protein